MRHGLLVESLHSWMAIRTLSIVNLIMSEIFRMTRRASSPMGHSRRHVVIFGRWEGHVLFT